MTHLEDVQTNRAAGKVDVRVVTWGIKLYRRSGVGIVWRERDGNLEAQASIDLAIGGQQKD